MDLFIIGLLQGLFLLALLLLAGRLDLGWPFAASLAVAAGLFAWQLRLAREREAGACLQAFLHNHWVGAVLFAGVVGGYLLKVAPVAG